MSEDEESTLYPVRPRLTVSIVSSFPVLYNSAIDSPSRSRTHRTPGISPSFLTGTQSSAQTQTPSPEIPRLHAKLSVLSLSPVVRISLTSTSVFAQAHCNRYSRFGILFGDDNSAFPAKAEALRKLKNLSRNDSEEEWRDATLGVLCAHENSGFSSSDSGSTGDSVVLEPVLSTPPSYRAPGSPSTVEDYSDLYRPYAILSRASSLVIIPGGGPTYEYAQQYLHRKKSSGTRKVLAYFRRGVAALLGVSRVKKASKLQGRVDMLAGEA